MLSTYYSFCEMASKPLVFLSLKEGFCFEKRDESSNALIRMGAAFFNIPVSAITAIAFGIISLLSFLPFAFLKIIGSEKREFLKDIIQINDHILLGALAITIGSIANLFTFTFARSEIRKGLDNFLCEIEAPLQTIGFLA